MHSYGQTGSMGNLFVYILRVVVIIVILAVKSRKSDISQAGIL
jgi:hypothetical protein